MDAEWHLHITIAAKNADLKFLSYVLRLIFESFERSVASKRYSFNIQRMEIIIVTASLVHTVSLI